MLVSWRNEKVKCENEVQLKHPTIVRQGIHKTERRLSVSDAGALSLMGFAASAA